MARISAALGLVLLALLAGAPGAGAIVAKIHARGYGVTPRRGVAPHSLPGTQPRSPPSALSRPGARDYDELPLGGSALKWLGGPVMHTNNTHVVYWDPAGEFTSTTKGVINRFFVDVAHDSGLATNVFGTNGQYTDGSGNAAYSYSYGGELVDSKAYPASGCTIPKVQADPGPPYTKCLTDTQLQTELSSFITTEKLPKGPTQLYFVLFPHKVVTCLEAGICSNNIFCAYHSWMSPGAGEIIYADIPFSLLDSEFAKGCQSDGLARLQHPNGDVAGEDKDTRFADVAIKYISHEWSEAVTDPLVEVQTAWVDEEGLENGDKCNAVPLSKSEEGEPGFDRHAFTPTLGGTALEENLFNQAINGEHFYVQSEWDNVAKACLMKPLEVSSAGFTQTASTTVVGNPVSFTGGAADPYGAPAITWSFGDGSTASGPSPSHSYGAAGSYTVTMTVRDALTGSSAAVQHAVVVNDLPTALFTTSPNPATVGAPVGFNGSASSDPDGSITSYAWSFGDGSTAGGPTATHAYAAPGTYTASLTVTDSAGLTASSSQQITVKPRPNSVFGALIATVNRKTGAITFKGSVSDPGTFSWLLTFQNGRFGVFASANGRCKNGLVRLRGRCRPPKIVFGTGRKPMAAGAVSFTVTPSASARSALKNALKRRKGVPLTASFTFQSSLGGSPFSRGQSLTIRLKKR